MTTITITIQIEADDATVRINPPDTANVARQAPAAIPAAPFMDDLEPLPPEPTAFRGAAMGNVAATQCPVHHEPWKTIPAGISKKDGRPYDSFRVCPVQDCKQKPAA